MIRSAAVVVFAAVLAAMPCAAQSQEDETDVQGYDKVRIEQEDKLWVPLERAQAVWEYLEQRLVKDTEFIKSLDPAFTSSYSKELFHDTYYDTPTMQLYARQSGVRHRKRENLSNPEDRKSGRELMQIKLNDISENQLERAEIKFEIEYPTTKASAMDTHPLFGIVKPSQRGLMQQRLKAIGLDGMSMKPILTVRDVRTRIYVLKDMKPFMSISHDQASSGVWWGRTRFCELEPELNEIGFTEADPATRAYMESVLQKVVADIRAKFPEIEQNLTPKYNKAFDGVERQVPFLRMLVRVGMQGTLGMVLFFAAVALGAFGAFTFARKRAKQRSSTPAAAAGLSGSVAAAPLQRK